MQPYLFPYLGYMQLVAAADTFVFYDDVSFIKGGWINRNRILSPGGGVCTFSVSLEGGQSPSRLIVDTRLSANRDWRRKFDLSLRQAYARAPHLEKVVGLVGQVLDTPAVSIADLAIRSVELVAQYIGLTAYFERSSSFAPATRELGRVDRLIALTKMLKGDCYLNMDGGRKLYVAAPFEKAAIELRFLSTHLAPYQQGSRKPFEPGLSVLDALMWNTPEVVRNMALQGQVAP